ncbi:hypothetical protein JHK86_033872 [Glycine max]|nr:hypothetical protein JHK86_033872 [Glycine max]
MGQRSDTNPLSVLVRDSVKRSVKKKVVLFQRKLPKCWSTVINSNASVFDANEQEEYKREAYRVVRGSFILSYVLILVFLLILASNQVQFKDTLRSSLTTTTTTSPQLTNYFSSNSDNNLRILIGILTLPDQHLRRNLLRLVYGTQPAPPGAKINVKFVFCNLTKEDQKVLVALEIMRYGDIIILDCKENMNNGKTLTYFSSLPEMLNDTASSYPPYHYMMKTDDDTYLRLNILVQSLKPLSREDLYYGYVIPCRSIDPFVRYMSGMGYLVS